MCNVTGSFFVTSPGLRGNWNVILRLVDIQRRMTKIIQRLNDYSFMEGYEKLEKNTLPERRIRNNPNETFKIMEFVMAFFQYFLQLKIFSQNRFQKLSLHTFFFFLLFLISFFFFSFFFLFFFFFFLTENVFLEQIDQSDQK